jgi:hypothetical protein
MDNTTSDENDDDDLPSSHPAVIAEMRRRRRQRQQHRGGWQGEEMELQHKQNQQQDSSTKDVSAAVDLKQFQNTEVGVGYQAKHVIRQRTSAGVAVTTTTTTTTNNKQDVSTNNLKHKSKKMTYDHNNTAQVIPTKEEFVRNDGLRMFRKEIENILSTPACLD